MGTIKFRNFREVPLALLASMAAMGHAQGQDLTQLSLDDLMRIEVVSASKRTQSLQDIAASVFVLTGEDIRRSGAGSIPSALRLVPGVQVSRLGSGTWSVGIRGFDSRFSNKLLVMVNGRSVYTPLFSGVYWDAVDVPLDLIDRVEVIRGPGGAIWGANAVNGVINIVTKSSADTQGSEASVALGSQDKASASVLEGGAFKDGTWRIQARDFDRGHMLAPTGERAQDTSSGRDINVRVDWSPRSSDQVEFDAGIFHETTNQVFTTPLLGPPYEQQTLSIWDAKHSFARGAWQRDTGSGGKTSLQLSYDGYRRNMPEVRESRSTIDLEVRHQQTSQRGTSVVGVGLRSTSDESDAGPSFRLSPSAKTQRLFNAFYSNEFLVAPKTLLTVGAKLEHLDESGWNFQPNIRILKTLSADTALWGSVSRAVRSPSRTDAHGILDYSASPGPGGLPALVQLVGSGDYDAEKLTAYEAGWRSKVNSMTSVDVSAYYNDYTDLRTFEPGAPYFDPSPTPHWVQPFTFANLLRGRTLGAEVVVRHQPTNNWGLMFGYTFENSHLVLDPSSNDPFGAATGDGRARGDLHQFSVRSTMDLDRGFQFDTSVSYAGRFPSAPRVQPHLRWDMRFGWKPNPNMDVSLAFRDLLTPRVVESNETLFGRPNATPRSVLAQVTWRF